MPLSRVFQTIYEDNHLLIVNKSGGVLVQGDQTGDKPLADYCKEYIKEKYNKPGDVFLGVIHRIDRPVSGLVIFAKTSKALERMNKMFKFKEVQKTYWAIVNSPPPQESGKLIHWLKKDTERNISKAYNNDVAGGKESVLYYKLLGRVGADHLLEITPVTGRPHQIRVQLAKIGCIIRGDLKYGFSQPNPDGNINLHSKKVSFIHPVQKGPVEFEAPLPDQEIWKKFGI